MSADHVSRYARPSAGRAYRGYTPWLALLVGIGLVLAIASSCATAQRESRPYPAGLVSELADLKASNGLFAQPSAFSLGEASLYYTALVAEIDAAPAAAKIDRTILAGNTGAALVPATLHTWAYVRLAQQDTKQGRVRVPNGAGLSTALPKRSGDVGEEIGMLWAWADTAQRITPAPSSGDLTAARVRLSAVESSEVNHPYLLWKLEATGRLLGRAAGPGIEARIAKIRVPDQLDSPEAVLDTRAYLELAPGHGLPRDPNLRKRLQERLKTTDPGDDLLVATLARSLELLGSSDEVGSVLAGYDARRDPATGLVRSRPLPVGTVESTYLVAQLVPQDFPSIAGHDTREALWAFLHRETPAPLAERLRAVAALRLAGDPRWNDDPSLVEAGLKELAQLSRDRAHLGSAVNLVDTLRAVEAEVPAISLTVFDVVDAESDYDARVALANEDIFSNSKEVGTSFAATQGRLRASVIAPGEPAKVYFVGLRSLAGARLAQITAEDQQKIRAGLESLRGCSKRVYLYRSTVDPAGECSLEATRYAITSGYAYSGGENQ